MVAALVVTLAVKSGGALTQAPALGKETGMGPVLYVIAALAVVALVVLVVILERLHVRSTNKGIPLRGSVRAR